MTSIVELFPKCRKLCYDARQQIFQVAQHQCSLNDLLLTCDELDRQLSTMQTLSLQELPTQRTTWQRKIAELQHESQLIRQQGQQAATAAAPTYHQQRDELLRRRRRRNSEEADVHNLAAESQSLDQSHYMVHSLIGTGQASLEALVEQRGRLRGITGIVWNMTEKLGLSQATMRVIERRDITDAYLVAAGMLVTCLTIYLVWF